MKERVKNLTAFVVICVAVFFLHVLATKLSFYYIFWWYDSLLHILGGIGASFFILLLVKNNKQIILPLFAGFVGVVWEIFERIGHVWWPSYIGFGAKWDTVFDVLCAILGALIVIAFKSTWQKNNTTHI
jgi:hypothetical protein